MEKQSLISVVALTVLLAAPVVGFGQAELTSPLVISVSNAGGGSYNTNIPLDGGTFTGTKEYTLTNVDLGGIATLESLRLVYTTDPSVTLNFSVVNTTGFPTDFAFASGLLSFPAINSPIASATAGVTVTDRNFPFNGATIGTAAGDPFSG